MCAHVRAVRGQEGILYGQRQCGHWFGECPVGEDFASLGDSRVVFNYVNANGVEDGPVQPSLVLIGDFVVKRDGATHEAEEQVHAFTDEFLVGFAGADETLGVLDLGQNAGLSGAEVIFVNDAVQIGVDQALLLALQQRETLALPFSEGLVVLLVQLELDENVVRYTGDLFLREVHLIAPFAANLSLDFLGGQIWQVAAGAAGVPSEAEEVGILAALAAGVPKADTALAAVTDQRSFEVVAVSPRPIAGKASPTAHALDLVPGVIVHDRLVRAVVDDPTVHDLADVVRVAEHAVHLGIAQRVADVLEGLAAAKASLREQVAKRRDAGLPFRV